MHVFTAKITKKLPIFMLIAVLIMLAIVGSMPSSSASAFPQSGNAFYGSATNLEGGSVPYDPAAPTDPALTTMIYARDVSRILNFDGLDAFSSGEYFGRPVTADAITGETRFGYSPQAFIFPAYDTEDSSSGAHNGDEIEFYICPPGREIPGVLVTMEDGSPLRAVFGIGGLTELNLSADVVPPAPEAVSPLDGAVDVLKDAPITILFDEDISLEVLMAFHIAGSTSGDLLSGDPSLGVDGRTVTLPHLDFDDFGETITVTIDAGAVSDAVDNLNLAYSWSFETYPYFFTISGNVGMEGVTLGYGEGLSVTAGLGGVYSLVVENGWTGTVTPELEGYAFEPAFRSYTDVTEDLVDQDYVATLLTFTISGNAGMEGVELRDGAVVLATTNADGDYSFIVDYGWSGTVTPVLEGYGFDPLFRIYSDVNANQENQDYEFTPEVDENLIYIPIIFH